MGTTRFTWGKISSFLMVFIERVRYRATTKRDERLDLLRGFCMTVMLFDHIGEDSLLNKLTGDAKFYISAAEGFICISGFIFGVIYRTIGERDGMSTVWRKALHRAFSLYLVMLASTLVLICGGVIAHLSWTQVSTLSDLGGVLWRVATIQQMYRLSRILMMYSLLILVAPVGIWLLRNGRVGLLLAISWALYIGYQISPRIFSFPLSVDAYFSPTAYQIIFVHLMALGYHRKAVADFFTPQRRLALFVVSALSLGAMILVFASEGRIMPQPLVDPLNFWVGKLFYRDLFRPGRLVAVVATVSFAYLLVTYLWTPIQQGLGWLLMPLGSYSLYAYTMHMPFTVLFDWLSPMWEDHGFLSLLINAIAQVAVLLTIWLMVRRRILFRIFPN